MLVRRRYFALLIALALCSIPTLAQQAAPADTSAPAQADSQAPNPLPYLDTKLTPRERAHDLVSRMTLEEKANQLEDWATSIPRLGIPDYQTWNEALHGVARAGYSTVFPQAIGMAATWNTDALRSMGNIISFEARGKYNQAQREGNHRIFFGLTFWSPNINIFRDPRWGRGQETYGEDPFLTGRLGVAFIKGVQGDDLNHLRAVATSKHFAVHSGPEQLRHGFNVDPSPRDLEESYLPAFRATVTEGPVQSVMCAYNSIDEWPACTNKMLLKEHLRDAWGFKGFVVSDCGAIVDVNQGHKKTPDVMHSAALSIQAGTDLSCSIWTPGFNTLAEAVHQGLVTEDLVTQAAERLYTARMQLGLFDPLGSMLDKTTLTASASSQNRNQSLHYAEQSIVLLKNNGVLPLKNPPAHIAVVGPTADLLSSINGNYVGTPYKPVTPLDGVVKQFNAEKILYAQGSTLAAGVGVPVPRTAFATALGAANGLKTEFFGTPDWTGRPIAVETEPAIQADWENAKPVPVMDTYNYSVRWSGTITAPAAGHYVFTLEQGDSFPYSPVETYRFILDGKVLSEGSLRKGTDLSVMGNFKAAPGASVTAPPVEQFPVTPVIPVDFADIKPHEIRVEYSHSGDQAGGGLTLKWQAPPQAQLDEALAQVNKADIVIAFVGLSPQLEGEEMPIKIDGFNGGDRTSLDLPAPQQKLLEAVAATGKPVIVVLQSGSAVALNWANKNAAAILEAWYPGVEGGTAIARTLAGLNNPAGRLPVTFYASLDGLPEFTDYSFHTAKSGRTYRYFNGKPLWGFGYGLSYSSFKYGPVKLSVDTLKAGDPLTATVTVTNAGGVNGDEVVEAYLKTPQKDGPIHSLVGFQRLTIAAGESKEFSIVIDPRSISSVDDQGNRSILPGKYTLTLGGAQPQDTAAKSEATFTVTGALALPK
jgi:beta-glucosidase